jgi:predicted nucleic acid-binding protein
VTQRPWLIDKSALVRLGDCREQELGAERIERGLVHVTTITLLETGCSARSAGDICHDTRTGRSRTAPS